MKSIVSNIIQVLQVMLHQNMIINQYPGHGSNDHMDRNFVKITPKEFASFRDMLFFYLNSIPNINQWL